MFKRQTEPKTPEQWESLIASLEADLSALRETNLDAKNERRALSLAIARGDVQAEERAQRLELTGLETDLRIKTLTEALEQAQERLQEAQGRQQAAERRQRADVLRAAAQKRREASQRLDESLSDMASSIRDWFAAAEEVEGAGGNHYAHQHRGMLAGAVWHHLIEAGLSRNGGWRYRVLHDCFSGDSRPSPGRYEPASKDDRVVIEALCTVAGWEE